MTSYHGVAGDAATRTYSTRATIGAGPVMSEFGPVRLPAAAMRWRCTCAPWIQISPPHDGDPSADALPNGEKTDPKS